MSQDFSSICWVYNLKPRQHWKRPQESFHPSLLTSNLIFKGEEIETSKLQKLVLGPRACSGALHPLIRLMNLISTHHMQVA